MSTARETAERIVDASLEGRPVHGPLIEPFTVALEEKEQERDTALQQRNNLLARIHRDGGHYLQEHGEAKALDDADRKVADLYGQLEEKDQELTRLRGENEQLRKALEPLMRGWFKAEERSKKTSAAEQWFKDMPGDWPFNAGADYPATMDEWRCAAELLNRKP